MQISVVQFVVLPGRGAGNSLLALLVSSSQRRTRLIDSYPGGLRQHSSCCSRVLSSVCALHTLTGAEQRSMSVWPGGQIVEEAEKAKERQAGGPAATRTAKLTQSRAAESASRATNQRRRRATRPSRTPADAPAKRITMQPGPCNLSAEQTSAAAADIETPNSTLRRPASGKLSHSPLPLDGHSTHHRPILLLCVYKRSTSGLGDPAARRLSK